MNKAAKTSLFFLVLLQATVFYHPKEARSGETFDEIKYCRELANSSGGKWTIEQSCRESEMQAKRALSGRSIPHGIYTYCYEIAKRSGGSNSALKSCVENEQVSNESIERRPVPPEIYKYCTELKEFASSGYLFLEGCINNELEAKERLEARR